MFLFEKKKYWVGISLILSLFAVLALVMKIGFPYYRFVAIGFYVLSWIPLIFGVRHHVRKRKKPSKDNPKSYFNYYKAYYVWAIVLFVVAYTLWALFPVNEDNFFGADLNLIEEQIEDDITWLMVSMNGLDRSLEDMKNNGELFKKETSTLSIDEKAKILDMWAVYIDHGIQLERLRETHSQFYQISYIERPELNARSFLIAYSALLKNLNNAVELHKLIGRNPFMKTLLNEEHKDLGIPAGSYLYIEESLSRPSTFIRLNVARGNLWFLEKSGQLMGEDQHLVDFVREEFLGVYSGFLTKPDYLSDAAFSTLEHKTFTFWFPIQKEVAKSMSLIRITNRDYFVSEKQTIEANELMNPGDIIVARKNWFLSNAGLPGFWPHAALYTGNLSEMDEYFGRSEVLNGLRVSEYLKENNFELYEDYLNHAGKDNGRILEAVKDGIVLHSLQKAAEVDYLGVVRPRLSKDDKLIALKKAFGYYGVPYDFDFDFVTDNKLVCSELIYKSYESHAGYEGLNFTIDLTAGRWVVSPNAMVEQFDAAYDNEDRQLDFVLFLDGLGGKNKAYFADIDDFRESWMRPKWSIYQE